MLKNIMLKNDSSFFFTFIAFTAICLAHFSVDFMLGIWPYFKLWAQIDLTSAGILGGIAVFLSEIMQPFFGSLSDRYNRAYFIIGALLLSIAVLALPLVSFFALFFVLLLSVNIGSALFHPSGIAIAGTLSDKQRYTLICLFSFSGSLGLGVSQYLYSYLLEISFSFSLLILIFPLLGSLLFLLIAQQFSPNKNCSDSKPPLSLKYLIRSLLNKPGLLSLYTGQVFSASVYWGTIFLFPNLMQEIGADPFFIKGGAHMIFVVSSAIAMLPLGFLSDKIGSLPLLVIAPLIGAFFMYFLPFFSEENFLGLSICLVLGGAFLGITQPLAVGLGQTLFPKNPGLVSALLMGGVWCISELFGNLGYGAIAGLFFLNPATNTYFICTLLVIPSSFFFFLTKKQIEKEEPFAIQLQEISIDKVANQLL